MESVSSPNPHRADKLAYYLQKSIGKASRDYRLLDTGDHVLVAVSGGKDSMTLLDLLARRRRTSREHYTLTAGLIRTDYHCGRAVPEDWLANWCAQRHIPLAVEDIQIAHEIKHTDASPCFRCAWNRRKALFLMADRLGCSKLALGHTADDLAETALLNLFYSARFHGMEPKVRFFDGHLTVIRPLAYIEEREIKPFVKASGYPIEGTLCPQSAGSKRSVMKELIRSLETDCHDVKRHILRAVERCDRNDPSAKVPIRTKHHRNEREDHA